MMISKEKKFWWAAFLVFLFDQVTKMWAVSTLKFEQEIYISELLGIRRIYNEDTIMMVFHSPMGINKLTFVLLWLSICCLVTLGIAWVTRQPSLNGGGWTEEFAKTGLFLILGAAWGNAFDRIFRVGVVDFIEFKMDTHFSPIINIADIMVYVGEFCLFLAWFCIIFNALKNYNIKNKNLFSLSNRY